MGPIRSVIRPPPGAAAGETAVSSAFNLLPRRPRTPSSPYSLSNHHLSHKTTSSSPFFHLQRAYTQAATLNHTNLKLSTKTLIPAISHRVDAHTANQHGNSATTALQQLSALRQSQTGRTVAAGHQGGQTSALSSGVSALPLTSLYQRFKQHLPSGVPPSTDSGAPSSGDSANLSVKEKSHQIINKQIISQETNALYHPSNVRTTEKANTFYSTQLEGPGITTYPFNLSDDEESEELHGEHQNWKISDIVETDDEGLETRTSTPTDKSKIRLNFTEKELDESERGRRITNQSDQDNGTRKHNSLEAKETVSNKSHVHHCFSDETPKQNLCSSSGKQAEQASQCNNSLSRLNKWLHTESQSQCGETIGHVICQPTSNKNLNKVEYNTDLDNESIELSSDEDDIHSEDDGNHLEDSDDERIAEDQSGKRNQNTGAPTEGTRATGRLRPRSYRQFLVTRERRSRVFLKARSHHLGRWFVTHFSHPYPSKDQKDQLATKTNMNRNQVSEWFGNMRRRIREATRRLNLCWEERVRVYNSVITGKSEPLPILTDDAINFWVPPTVIDSSQTDSQEETTASHKFKRTLLHRYLNDSYETSEKVDEVSHWKDYQDCQGNLVDSNYKTGQNHPKVNHKIQPQELASQSKSVNQYPVNPLNITQSRFEKPEKSFHYTAPLCTSSPKENSDTTWSNQMDIFNKDHSHMSSQMPKDQACQKTQTLYGYASKLLYKQECQNNDSTNKLVGCKKPLLLSPLANWLSQTSSNGLSNYFLTSQKRPEVAEPMTSALSPSYHNTQNDIELKGSGVPNLVIHKPEELAAAYTLVELQQM